MDNKQLSQIETSALQELNQCQTSNALDTWHQQYLGKEGKINQLTQEIPNLPTEDRPQAGKNINNLKKTLKKAFREKEVHLDETSREVLPGTSEYLDLTAPGRKPTLGHLHPITKVREKAENIFTRMGFRVYEAREIDDDYHVFESLNIPPDHPARDIWDTIWTENELVCTTHTSSMQNRILRKEQPPFRAIICGRCFRYEKLDPTHEHTFYQIEGLCVDRGITLADLIGTLKTFLSEFYQRKVNLKIQPSYFPFVEPGLEFMIDCALCQGQGEIRGQRCTTCGGSGWIELVPAGMIHPRVLKEANLDPEEYQGFAWGMGLDRLVMIKYGIEDIRHFHRGDLRFIRQF